MLIIGDTHGKVKEYYKLIQNQTESIQLGDFGFKSSYEWYLNNVDISKHKIVMGNHDDYNYIDYTLGNWSYVNNIFTIRGANSIDKSKRIEGVDWFNKEELNYFEANEVMDNYEKVKPSIVVSHDCPAIIAELFFNFPKNDYNYKTFTRSFLDGIFEIHKPDLWIFAHHHSSRNEIVDTTRFICLNELETISI